MQPISLTVSLMMQNFSAPEFILSFAATLFFFAMLYLLCKRIYIRKITNRFHLNDFDYVINNRQALIGIKNDRNSSRSAGMYMLAVPALIISMSAICSRFVRMKSRKHFSGCISTCVITSRFLPIC